jgi:large subunit ribosomal protein L9
MKVIMLQDVYKTGVAGEIVDVADGFARNYLIPRKMAKLATKAAIEENQELMEKVEARRATYNKLLNDLARQIDGVELIFERRASSTGTLYGSVTTQEIADALMEATEIDINRRRISQQSLRELGEFQVPVRLGNEIAPILNIIIVREGELEDFLAAREAGESVEEFIGGEDEDEADIEAAPTEVLPAQAAAEAIEQAEATNAEEEDTETVSE